MSTQDLCTVKCDLQRLFVEGGGMAEGFIRGVALIGRVGWVRGRGRGIDWVVAMSRDFTFPRTAGANSTTTKSEGEIIKNVLHLCSRLPQVLPLKTTMARMSE